MRVFVVDASLISALLIPSQRTGAAYAFIASSEERRLIAPYVLSLEAPWLLLKYERRIAQSGFSLDALAELAAMRVRISLAPDAYERQGALRIGA